MGKIKPKRKQKNESYVHQIGEKLRYIGFLYDQYHNQEVTVISRSRDRANKEYYHIQCLDGNIVTVLGTSLEKIKMEGSEI